MSGDELSRFEESYKVKNERLLSSYRENGELYDLRCETKKYCYDDCHVLATAFSIFKVIRFDPLAS